MVDYEDRGPVVPDDQICHLKPLGPRPAFVRVRVVRTHVLPDSTTQAEEPA